jgi:Cupin superfamily protein
MTVLTGISDDAFAQSFGRTPILLRHDLSDHPLLTVERVAQLADSLPLDHFHHKPGAMEKVDNPDERDTAETPGEIARGAEANGRWLVVDNIEADPEYRALVHEVLGQVPEHLVAREGGKATQEGQIFLSAAASVVPPHTDSEHNFLLQIQGEKHVTVGRFPSEDNRQRYLERFRGGGAREIGDELEDVQTYVLKPGDGIYLAPLYPHAVRVGSGFSVSLSTYFETPFIRRSMTVRELNRHLRRLRIRPRPPGEHVATDKAKAKVVESLSRLRAMV